MMSESYTTIGRFGRKEKGKGGEGAGEFLLSWTTPEQSYDTDTDGQVRLRSRN